MHTRFSIDDSKLISDLYALSKSSKGKLVKSSEYDAPTTSADDPGKTVKVTSWKMNEFKYYDIPSPFPTLARGLFTEEVPDGPDGRKGYRIIVRGYDKFFNIGEVPWTTWQALKDHTGPPYTLTLKSNGCIIFIGALTPSKLVITSKHSLGAVGNAPMSHAQAGERWLKKYLDGKGKTEEDLAKRLWDENLTAVAELCDDSFEEHVLGYTPETTGLHLHGLNVCKNTFTTYDQPLVDAFADEWGFIKTKSTVLETIDQVREFTTSVGEAQEWQGEAVEGFVVRTRVVDPPSDSDRDRGRSPYRPNTSFFFKVKFDEPYMMYRDWRELTKALLSNGCNVSKLSKAKMKRKETQVYVRWVVEEIKRERGRFEGYTKGHGIIETRERFLRWLETEEGKKGLVGGKEQSGEEEGEQGMFKGKTVIVPVAIPGCGKTTIAIALTHLFGFGRTQSDDVKAKKPAPQFIKNVMNLLKTHKVVIADKNNHLRQHRTQLRDAVTHQKFTSEPIHLLALNWSLSSLPRTTIHRICGDRIAARGENHQTLVAGSNYVRGGDGRMSHEDVVWGFIRDMEELGEGEVDGVVEMEFEDDAGENDKGGMDSMDSMERGVRRAVEGVCKELGLEEPSEERIKEAVEKARAYLVPGKTGAGAKTKKGGGDKADKEEKGEKNFKNPRYYALLPEFDVEALLKDKFSQLSSSSSSSSSDKETKEKLKLWNTLLTHDRLTKRPHVTLVHERSLNDTASATQEDDRALWERCAGLDKLGQGSMFKLRMGNVLWDERVMVITVDDLVPDPSSSSSSSPGDGEENGGDQKESEFIQKLRDDVRGRLHVTVGTRDKDVPPVEGKALVELWRGLKRRGKGDVDGIWEMGLGEGDGEDKEGLVVRGRVRGLMQ